MIDKAIAALRDGKFILLYDFDDREGETDFAIRSDAVTLQHILRMRKDGGGLICTAIDPVAAQRLGLPFASDVLQGTHVAEQQGDIPYDRKNHSSFSLWVNHKNTFTGITDRDRALTITAIAEEVKKSLDGGDAHFSEFFRPRATVPSSGLPTTCSTSGTARPSPPSRSPGWAVSRHRSRSARCWMMSPADALPKSVRKPMQRSTVWSSSKGPKCSNGGKRTKTENNVSVLDPVRINVLAPQCL